VPLLLVYCILNLMSVTVFFSFINYLYLVWKRLKIKELLLPQPQVVVSSHTHTHILNRAVQSRELFIARRTRSVTTVNPLRDSTITAGSIISALWQSRSVCPTVQTNRGRT